VLTWTVACKAVDCKLSTAILRLVLRSNHRSRPFDVKFTQDAAESLAIDIAFYLAVHCHRNGAGLFRHDYAYRVGFFGTADSCPVPRAHSDADVYVLRQRQQAAGGGCSSEAL